MLIAQDDVRLLALLVQALTEAGWDVEAALVEHLVGRTGGELRLCHGGHHVTTGTSADVPCQHDERMTATVLVPLG
ncbi:hypothetical protein ASC64_16255 [Nocardioides sp. Root122]|uniref:hypothetical protein n=1 Tax=Nocardioides TaxID=1839 RepID=UPI000702FB66|nr:MULTISPECIES: hypothetical protein [Nocardioides]KQV64315.1 hypothetical protein ASC64_16255 [Nocardioides sp. Root122]MCK9824875.1 hypothetical protein [Nocardioides cavernae]